jgi:pyrroline-5-carboxylate reductase
MSGRASVAIIGVGAMGEALMSGLIRAGWAPEEISLCVRRVERAEELAERSGSVVSPDPAETIKGRQVVVIAVKPFDVPTLLDHLSGHVRADQMVLSLAAGVTTGTYESRLGPVPVVRAMPNTPALVGEGVTGIAAGANARPEHLDLASAVLGAVGSVRIMDENLLDAVTAVSGTGPAYVFLLAEALAEAGVLVGLPRPTAEALVRQTLLGAARLLVESGEPAEALRAGVTSPGGTTAAGLRELEAHGVRAAILDAVTAATKRSKELGS